MFSKNVVSFLSNTVFNKSTNTIYALTVFFLIYFFCLDIFNSHSSSSFFEKSVRFTDIFRFVVIVRDNAGRTEEQKQVDDGPIKLKFI